MLVTSVTNVGYLTGFSGDSSALILTRDRQILVSDGRYTTQIEEECPTLEIHIRPVGQLLPAAIADAIRLLSIKRVGIESHAITLGDHEDILKAAPTIDLVPTRGRVEALRAVKDREEILAIREAIGFAERAFARFRAGIRPDDTEQDLADAIEADLRRCGATGSSFPPIVASGERSALPHARPSDRRRLSSDEFVLIDWGASGRPYKSDLTRVLVTGKVSSKFEKLYRIVLEAQERGIAALRPGATAGEVDLAARSFIEQSGYASYFTHGLGHGLGRDIHEAPFFRSGSDVKLRAGMVVTIEPGIYLPGWGGIRIEDDVLVTPDGCEVLTSLPRSLDSVRLN